MVTKLWNALSDDGKRKVEDAYATSDTAIRMVLEALFGGSTDCDIPFEETRRRKQTK